MLIAGLSGLQNKQMCVFHLCLNETLVIRFNYTTLTAEFSGILQNRLGRSSRSRNIIFISTMF